jgi:diguanylate cyclase (GGDEF)-like protein/PAS domain S-box-containing protein
MTQGRSALLDKCEACQDLEVGSVEGDGDPRFYREVLDNLYDGVYFVDRERVVTFWNRGAERISGYASEQMLGHSCRDHLLNHVSADGEPLCRDRCPLAACMADGVPREAEVFLHHADGHRVPVVVRGVPLRDASGAIVGAVETFSGNAAVWAAREEVRELRRRTQSDGLTGAASRSHAEGRLRAVVAEYAGCEPAAGLIFADVDHFKRCNDIYGHEVGDRVLRMVVSTLIANVRGGDVVGRWGGEEFVVLVNGTSSQVELAGLAEKLRALVAASRLDLDEQGLSVTISMGATLLRAHDSSEALVRRADQLMYESKSAGRDRVTVG